MEATTLIQVAVGGLMIIFGLHQIFRPEQWTNYIPRTIKAVLPMHPVTFMKFHALGNIALGILFAFGIGMPAVAWVTLVWFATIILSAVKVDWTIAFRDLIIGTLVILYLMIR